MNILDYIIIGAVLVCVIIAVICIVKRRKNKGCGCGCEGCAYRGECNKKQ